MQIAAFFSDDPAKILAVVVVAVGLLILIGAVLSYFIPIGAEPPVGSNDSRAAQRRRVLKAARIEFSGSAVDCTVRNISETGAALEVTSSVRFPVAFVLAIPSDGCVKHCHVVWRR